MKRKHTKGPKIKPVGNGKLLTAAEKAAFLAARPDLVNYTAKPKKPKAAKPIDHPFKPSDDFERAALRVWTRLVEKELGVADKARGRQVMRAIFKAEEEAERKASATTKGGGK